ncbi:TetR/AcrR family transcriptional regulator [Paenibacillus sp. UNC451MF]|uniref:TetR/AcrR family transcriptional regulator n=1 Tax=Paenibacillus sp. UNC451MF TaxID=1449063 RepID=UPI00056A6330|nr:TetR/AcrR family transcriptional regulator [Paenibacillus sp. UNC451MF]
MTITKIKAAALRLFALKGYEATPLSEIAKEVGIKTPSLYAHFKGKEDLFLAIFEDVIQEHFDHVTELATLIAEMSVHDKLYTILQDACQTYLLSEESITFLKRAMLFPPESLQQELQRRFPQSEAALSEVLRDIFEKGMREGIIRHVQVEELLASFYCLLDGTFIQQHYYARTDFERRIQSIWRLYWQGIIVQHQE